MHIAQRGVACSAPHLQYIASHTAPTASEAFFYRLLSALHNLTNSRDRKDAWRGCLAEKAGKRKRGAFGEHETVKSGRRVNAYHFFSGDGGGLRRKNGPHIRGMYVPIRKRERGMDVDREMPLLPQLGV